MKIRPRRMSPRASTGSVRAIATMIAVTLTLALTAVAGCQSRQDPKLPSVQDKFREARLIGKERLRIGVAEDEPLMGTAKSGNRSGFDIAIARYIAESLGYDDKRLDLVSLSTTGDKIGALLKSEVDLVVASLSITPDREKLISFAGPYLITTQAVLIPVRMKGKIRTMGDLKKYQVCASGGSTTEKDLLNRGVQVLPENTPKDCFEGLLEGKYDAMSSDETLLAGFWSQHREDFEILELAFGTHERLGVGVSRNNKALRELVAYYLNKSYQAQERGEDTDWLVAYRSYLRPWLGEAKQPEPVDVPELRDFDDRAPQR